MKEDLEPESAEKYSRRPEKLKAGRKYLKTVIQSMVKPVSNEESEEDPLVESDLTGFLNRVSHVLRGKHRGRSNNASHINVL